MTTSRYESVTSSNTAKMTAVTPITRLKAAIPMTGTRMTSISSVPYEDEEVQSGARTPQATGWDSRSWRSCSLTSGFPSRSRFSR